MKNPSQKLITDLELKITKTLKDFETCIKEGKIPTYTFEDLSKEYIKLFSQDMKTLENCKAELRIVKKRSKEIVQLYIDTYIREAQNVLEITDEKVI
jgi:hypothetical protein